MEHVSKETTTLHGKDMVSVANKLQQFAKDLPKQELDILGWILYRAQEAPPVKQQQPGTGAARDLPGANTPMAVQVARSVGLDTTKDSDVGVQWAYRF
jgi:hypothetical protein